MRYSWVFRDVSMLWVRRDSNNNGSTGGGKWVVWTTSFGHVLSLIQRVDGMNQGDSSSLQQS